MLMPVVVKRARTFSRSRFLTLLSVVSLLILYFWMSDSSSSSSFLHTISPSSISPLSSLFSIHKDDNAEVVELIAAAAASGAVELDLSGRGLTRLPAVIGSLTRLQKLNLADNALSSLPESLSHCVALRILFFLNNKFKEIPLVVGALPSLEMLSFKSNSLSAIADAALAPSLRWLILTDNKLTSLPPALGRLRHLRKLMLATNQLEGLPDVSGLTSLELVRLSDNSLKSVPPSLLTLPKLAWLALAGNELAPLKRGDVEAALNARTGSRLNMNSVALGRKLGEGASGVVYHGVLSELGRGEESLTTLCGISGAVAVKIFKAASSDGRPIDELAALVAAPRHASLINAVGFVLDSGGTGGKQRLATVLEFCHNMVVLGNPPSFASITRDVFASAPAPSLTFLHAAIAARDTASALAALHHAGIAHGDVYAHNLMVDAALLGGGEKPPRELRVKLADLGAAFFYDVTGPDAKAYERIDARGYACLVEDMVVLATANRSANPIVMAQENLLEPVLRDIAHACGAEGNKPAERPLFADIEKRLTAALR